MTDVRKDENKKISTIEEALALYKPPPEQMTGFIGLEVEMLLTADGIVMPDAKTMQHLQKLLKDNGHDAQLEAAGVLEYASPPEKIADVGVLIEKAEKDIADFNAAVTASGLVRAPTSMLPDATVNDALAAKVGRERLDTCLDAIPHVLGAAALAVPLLTAGVQVSFSPKDEEEMFRMAKRAYALTPLIIATMNSGTGYVFNNPVRRDDHLRSRVYQPFGKAAGIAESFNKAASGKEYTRNHAEMVWDNPMFFAVGADGNLMPSAAGNTWTYRKLVAAGLGTQTNYALAESFLYHDVKICNLRDAQGQTVGKRLEVRAADSGLHQPYSMLLLTSALIPDGPGADALDDLLKKYGFTGHPPSDAVLLSKAHQAAAEHGGKFMDADFGHDTKGNAMKLRDFAADTAAIVVAQHGHDRRVAKHLSKLTDILLTGNCDAKIYAQQLKTKEQAVNVMKGGKNRFAA